MSSRFYYIFCAIVLTTIAQPAPQAAYGGNLAQIAKDIGCIKNLISDNSTKSGIATGNLSPHISLTLCNSKAIKLGLEGGKLKVTPFKDRPSAKPSWAGKDNTLPDGLITSASKQIRRAWLTQPTRRYNHAILGDDIEAGGLVVKLANRRKLELSLLPNAVFEDRFARLVDLNGDGKTEVIVIRTDLSAGSAIAIYGVQNLQLVEIAQSEPIGRSHRWLNPVAAADFDGDGNVELAWVETPHIGGTLKIARLTANGSKYQLKTLAKLSGFSNHIIGSRELLQSVTFDWNGDGHKDIILPGSRRLTLRVVSFIKGKLKTIDIMKIPDTIASPLIAADMNGDGRGEVLLVTKDNRLFSFSP